MFVINLNYLFDRECLWTFPDICLVNNVWKNPHWHLLGRECLKMPSKICLEKNPCNTSLLIVKNGIFVNAFYHLFKKMIVIHLNYLIGRECLWTLIFVWYLFGNPYQHLLGKKQLKTIGKSICNVFVICLEKNVHESSLILA